MASSFASSLRALARVMGVPSKRGAAAAALMARRAAGRGAGYAAAVCEVVVQGGDGVGGRAGGFQVDEVVDAVAAAGERHSQISELSEYLSSRCTTRPIGSMLRHLPLPGIAHACCDSCYPSP
jgi:hypothetical protein